MLNADFAHPACVATGGNGALRVDRKAGLRQEMIGGRAARRITEVDAMSRRIGKSLKLLVVGCVIDLKSSLERCSSLQPWQLLLRNTGVGRSSQPVNPENSSRDMKQV